MDKDLDPRSENLPKEPVDTAFALMESRSVENLDARLENLPKELIDIVIVHLDSRDLGALSATCKQLDSKLLDRKFENLHFHACRSEQKIKDVTNIVSNEHLRLTVRSVTIRVNYHTPGDRQVDLPHQMADFLPLLRAATNLTHLTIEDGVVDDLLPAITLPNLTELSLNEVCIYLDTIIDFIKVQPKLEKVHIDAAFVQDRELGDIDEDLGPMDVGAPPILERIFGFRPSVLIKERTAVKNVIIDERSDRVREPWLKSERRDRYMCWNGSMYIDMEPFFRDLERGLI